jgi:hypothetical protein
MFQIAPAEGIIILVILFIIGAPLWGLIDAARRPNEVFHAAGHSKGTWIALQFLLAPLGTLLYLIIVWPSLRRQSERADSRDSDKDRLKWR